MSKVIKVFELGDEEVNNYLEKNKAGLLGGSLNIFPNSIVIVIETDSHYISQLIDLENQIKQAYTQKNAALVQLEWCEHMLGKAVKSIKDGQNWLDQKYNFQKMVENADFTIKICGEMIKKLK